MIDTNRAVIFDGDELRRARICRALLDAGIYAEPFKDFKEFRNQIPFSAVILLHDEGTLLADFLSYSQMQKIWFPILVYDTAPSIGKIVRAVKSGAIDYLEWPFSCDQFRQKMVLLKDEFEHLSALKEREYHAYKRWLLLSKREQQVLAAICRGETSQEIATKLSISPKTVDIHRTNAIKKIGAKRSADAVQLLAEARGQIDMKRIA